MIFGDLVDQLREDVEGIKPMKAVFDPKYVSRLHGTWIKEGKTKMDLAKQLMDDIANFKATKKVDRCVMVWCGSTEAYLKPSEVHQTVEAFEKGLLKHDLILHHP